MNTIVKVEDYVVSGKFDVTCSIKADKESTVSKTLTLRFVMAGTPLKSVIDRALSSARIAWQNGPGRSKYDSWKNASTIEVDFASPARKLETRENKIAKYVAQGFDEKIATFAVDNPEKFAAVVNQVVTE